MQRESTVFLYDYTFENLDLREVVPRLKEVGEVGLVSVWPDEEVLPLVRELGIPFFRRMGLDYSEAADEVLAWGDQVRGERE